MKKDLPTPLKPGEDPQDFTAGQPEPLPEEFPAEMRQTKTVEVEVVAPAVPKKEEPRHQAAPPAPRPSVEMDARGSAKAFDLDQAYRVAKALWQGKGFPNWVKSAEQALAVSIFLKNLGLEVMTGVQHVCEVNGRLTLWGEGPLAAVRASGNLKSIKEGFYTAEYKEICFKNKNLDDELHFAFCRTVRKDNGEVKETWFSAKDEKTATQGLAAVWKGYRRTMFKRKARAENLKDNFGDVLEGAGIAEYDYEAAPDMVVHGDENKPKPVPLAERLNQKAIADGSEPPVQAG
jgi:hypothetical protein